LIAEECICVLTCLELTLLCKVYVDADFDASAVYACRNQGFLESDDDITPMGLPSADTSRAEYLESDVDDAEERDRASCMPLRSRKTRMVTVAWNVRGRQLRSGTVTQSKFPRLGEICGDDMRADDIAVTVKHSARAGPFGSDGL
jgi:hypothetical protein